MEKSVPTMLTARKNMSVSDGTSMKMQFKHRTKRFHVHLNMKPTFTGPRLRVGPLPETGVGGGGATLKDGVSILDDVWPFGSLDFHCQAETRDQRSSRQARRYRICQVCT